MPQNYASTAFETEKKMFRANKQLLLPNAIV